MVATNFLAQTSKKTSTPNIANKVQAALWCAQIEQRLVIGLNKAIKTLSDAPDSSLFCIMANSTSDDKKSTHIQEVLLEAFCYENEVYTIKVDSAEKLARILGIKNSERCVLVKKSTLDMENLTTIENEIVDYCEQYWNIPCKTPIILP